MRATELVAIVGFGDKIISAGAQPLHAILGASRLVSRMT